MENSEMILSEGIRVLALNTSLALKSILEGVEEDVINEISNLLADVFYELEKCTRESEKIYEQLQYKIDDNKQLIGQYNIEKNSRISADNKVIELEFKYNDVKFSLEDQISLYCDLKESLENKLNYYIKRDQISSENYYNLRKDFDKLFDDHHRLRTLYLSQIESQLKHNEDDVPLDQGNKACVLFDSTSESFDQIENSVLKEQNLLSVVESNLETATKIEEAENERQHANMNTSLGSCSNFSKIKKSAQHFVDSLLVEEMDFELELGNSQNTLYQSPAARSTTDSDDSGENKYNQNRLLNYDDSLAGPRFEIFDASYSQNTTGLPESEVTPPNQKTIDVPDFSENEDSSTELTGLQIQNTNSTEIGDISGEIISHLTELEDKTENGKLTDIGDIADNLTDIGGKPIGETNNIEEIDTTSDNIDDISDDLGGKMIEQTDREETDISKTIADVPDLEVRSSEKDKIGEPDLPAPKDADLGTSECSPMKDKEDHGSSPSLPNTTGDIPMECADSHNIGQLTEIAKPTMSLPPAESSPSNIEEPVIYWDHLSYSDQSANNSTFSKSQVSLTSSTEHSEAHVEGTSKGPIHSSNSSINSLTTPKIGAKSLDSSIKSEHRKMSHPIKGPRHLNTQMKPSISSSQICKPPRPKGRSLTNKSIQKTVASNVVQFHDLGINLGKQEKTEDKQEKTEDKQEKTEDKQLQIALVPGKICRNEISGQNNDLKKEVLIFQETVKASAAVPGNKDEEMVSKILALPEMAKAEPPKPPKRIKQESLSQFGDIRAETEKILRENKNLRDSCNALTTVNRELNQQMELMSSENELLNNRIQSLDEAKKLLKVALRAQTDQVSKSNREKMELENRISSVEDGYFTEYELISIMESRNTYKQMFVELRDYVVMTGEAKRKSKTSLSSAFKNMFKKQEKTRIKSANFDSLFFQEGGSFKQEGMNSRVNQSVYVNVGFPLDSLGEMPLTAVATTVSDGPVYTSTGVKIVGTSVFYPMEADETVKTDETLKVLQLNEKLNNYHKTVKKSRLGIEGSVSPRLWMSSSVPKVNESVISVTDINKPDSVIAFFRVSGYVLALESIPGCTHPRTALKDEDVSDFLQTYTSDGPPATEKDYFPLENELLKLSLSQLIAKYRTILPTVWIGCQNGSLQIFPSTNDFSSSLLHIQMPSSVRSIKHVNDRVFVGTSHNGLACFERGDDNQWSRNFTVITHCNDGDPIDSISVMVAIGDSILWVACRNKIFAVDCKNAICYKSCKIALSSEEINCLAWSGDGVWVSFCVSTTIRLYNIFNFNVIQEVNVTDSIPNSVLSSTPIKANLSNLTSPTTLKIFGNMLWVGHSSGIVQGFRFDIHSKSFDYFVGETNSHRVFKHTESIILPSTFVPRIDTLNPFILPIVHNNAVVGLNAVCNSDGNIDSIGRSKLDSIRVVSCGNGIRDHTVETGSLPSTVALATWNWSLIPKQE